ncbi:UNVERIFIED_CONTAM: hypothetical protein NCL1_18690 [Trichonephila clavipes]
MTSQLTPHSSTSIPYQCEDRASDDIYKFGHQRHQDSILQLTGHEFITMSNRLLLPQDLDQ